MLKENHNKKKSKCQLHNNGMVHLHKKKIAVINIDAITSTFPHGPDFQH